MYTVLLVDDEASMLETLIQSIHWQQYGVDPVLTVSDGPQALEVLASRPVDLLIADIKMPRMDGLSLLQTVRSTYPNTHCIILTAYEEFEYARQAIQLGVENYLLKPLNTEEMEESIERALDNIYASRRISDHLFRNNGFTRWVNRTISTTELAERANLLQLNLYLPEYCVVILQKKQHALSLSSYCQACVKQLCVRYDVHHFKDYLTRHVFIIGGASIYKQFLPLCKYAYITKLYAPSESDCWFHNLDDDPNWKLVSPVEKKLSGEIEYAFLKYENLNIKKSSD